MSKSSAHQTPEWLQPTIDRASALVDSMPWPDRRMENWKYSSVRHNRLDGFLVSADELAAKLEAPEAAQAILDTLALPKLETHRLVMLNGRYCADLSDGALSGLTISAFVDADETHQARIIEKLQRQLDSVKDRFQAQRLSAIEDGLWISVAAHTKIEKPIEILWLNTAAGLGAAATTTQLCLMNLENGAEACLIEHFHSEEALDRQLQLGQTHLRLERNAHLQHYALHQESEQAWVVSAQTVDLEQAAHYSGFQLALGAQLQRIDITVNHLGSQAHCSLNGVYLPKGDSHVDYHTTIEHGVPHCTSEEIFRGIIGDQARAVFNGRIHIHQDAQKTFAQLSNKNLLTSEKAEVNTKPELEIYADDVQCAHGATVAQLDRASVHYLKTRGIPEAEAIVMLSFGFVNELVDALPHHAIAEYLRPKLASRFTDKKALRKHIEDVMV